jgi:hypothetical protein
MKFVVDEVHWSRFLSELFGFHLLMIIPLLLHTHLSRALGKHHIIVPSVLG